VYASCIISMILDYHSIRWGVGERSRTSFLCLGAQLPLSPRALSLFLEYKRLLSVRKTDTGDRKHSLCKLTQAERRPLPPRPFQSCFT